MTTKEWLEVLASMDSPAMSSIGEELVAENTRLTLALEEANEEIAKLNGWDSAYQMKQELSQAPVDSLPFLLMTSKLGSHLPAPTEPVKP